MRTRVYRWVTVLFFLAWTAGALFHANRQRIPSCFCGLIPRVEEFFPAGEIQIGSKPDLPFAYFEIRQRPGGRLKKELAGFAFLTKDLAPDIGGFAGPIEMLVAIDRQGNIKGIRLLSHAETPSYTGPLEPFLERFIGLNAGSPLSRQRDIQGITGATITSDAIKKTLEECLRIMNEKVLNNENTQVPAVLPPTPGGVDAPVIAMIFLFVVAVAGFLLRNNVLRWAALLLSLVFLGIMSGTMLSLIPIVNASQGGNIPFVLAWLFALSLLSVLIWGRLYCGSICPFAAVQEMLYHGFQKLFHQRLSVSDSWDASLKWIKYGILIIITGVSLWLATAQTADVEVFLTLFRRGGTTLMSLFLFLILVISLFHLRFWCKYLCPTGAFLGLLSRGSLFKIRFEECTHCGKCRDICPTNAMIRDKNDQPRVIEAECILCGRCLQECPRATLRLFWKHDDKK